MGNQNFIKKVSHMALIDEILAELHCQIKTRVPRALKSRCSSQGERLFLTDLKLESRNLTYYNLSLRDIFLEQVIRTRKLKVEILNT